MKVIAGDIGGTKTLLAQFQVRERGLEQVSEVSYPSARYASLQDILEAFFAERPSDARYAAFGIAGPVAGRRVRTTNLPWLIDADDLESVLGLARVTLLNDLEATAQGVFELGEDSFRILNAGVAEARGNVAVIAAGTGLGEAGAYWDGERHRPFATEGGHAGFAPEDNLQRALLAFVASRYERVSWERVLSGTAMRDLFDFVVEHAGIRPGPGIYEEMEQGDAAAVITRAASEDRCAACKRTLDLFVRLYGSETGNLGLKMMALGGIYIGGGIAPRIADRLAGRGFMESFLAKGRMRPLVEAMPVRIILNDRAALLGAARAACLP